MFWRSKANTSLLVNLERADYFEIQGVKELDDYKVAAYFSGICKVIFKGSYEECNLFLSQVIDKCIAWKT
jgi:effector-binding domain-containing protein